MKRLLVFVALTFVIAGCATEVSDPVDQLPPAPEPRQPAEQTFGSPLRQTPVLDVDFRPHSDRWSKPYVDMDDVPPKQEPNIGPHIAPPQEEP